MVKLNKFFQVAENMVEYKKINFRGVTSIKNNGNYII